MYVTLYIVLQLCHCSQSCALAFSSHLSAIETLTPSNYNKWRRDIELSLGLHHGLGLDMCLQEDKPKVLDDDNLTGTKSRLEKWEISNRLSLIIIKRTISEPSIVAFPVLFWQRIP